MSGPAENKIATDPDGDRHDGAPQPDRPRCFTVHFRQWPRPRRRSSSQLRVHNRKISLAARLRSVAESNTDPAVCRQHSIALTEYFEEHWGDPGYLHHAAMAKLAGIAALRLANAGILPFQYSRHAAEVSGYLDGLSARQSVVSFEREAAQAEAWKSAALDLEDRSPHRESIDPTRPMKTVAFINERLVQQEHDLTQPKGLPGRPGSCTPSTRRASIPATACKRCRRSKTRWPRAIGRPRATTRVCCKRCDAPSQRRRASCGRLPGGRFVDSTMTA
jgi:hypothetical protein